MQLVKNRDSRLAEESRAEEAREHQAAAKAAAKKAKKQRQKANKQEDAQAAPAAAAATPRPDAARMQPDATQGSSDMLASMSANSAAAAAAGTSQSTSTAETGAHSCPVRQADNQAAANGPVPAGSILPQQTAGDLTDALPGAMADLQLQSEPMPNQTRAAPAPSLFDCPLTKVCVTQAFVLVMCLGPWPTPQASQSQQACCLPCFAFSSVMCAGLD